MKPLKKSIKKDSAWGGGCLILFGLPFLGAGVLVGSIAFGSMADWWEISSGWVEVPATILQADLETHTGDDSTTYSVKALYEYEFQGKFYENDRVALTGGADNIGSFHHDAYRELDEHRRSGEPFMCWVDPDDPGRSILYPDPRWGLLLFMGGFSLVFSGAGLGVMIAGLFGWRKGAVQEKQEKRHPSQPWLWKEEWKDSRIKGSSRRQFWFMAFFAGVWNLISWPIALLIIPSELEQENLAVLIALLFPLVGLLLAYAAVHMYLKWRKFGDTVLEMSSMPGVIGGYLSGRLLTGVKSVPPDGFRLSLNCVHQRVTGSGDNRKTRETVLWQETAHVPPERVEPGMKGCMIPVRFAIPYDAQGTDESNRNDKVIWKLKASAEMPGIDYSTDVEVPVFKTSDSNPDFKFEESFEMEPESVDEVVKSLSDYGIEVEETLQGRRYRFKPKRVKGLFLGMALVFLVWTGIVAAIAWAGAPLFFVAVFALFDVLLVVGFFSLWLGENVVITSPSGLSFSGGMLGLSRSLTDVFPVDIEKLDISPGLTVNDRVYYRIQLVTCDGKKHTLASQLDNKRLARRLVREFEEPWKDA